MIEKPAPRIVPTKEGYDLWSEIYDTDGNPLVHLEEPQVIRMLGDVGGLSVLDVACGTGRHTLRLAGEGADVTGIDFSEGMLAKAREKSGAHSAKFIHHDVATRWPFENGKFDRVLNGLVLDHIANLDFFFAELRRVCNPNGFIVASVMHPAMMLKGVQARFHDAKTGAEIRPESSPNQISDYVTATLKAGLRIDEISEYVVEPFLVKQTPRAEKYLGWPMLLMMKLLP